MGWPGAKGDLSMVGYPAQLNPKQGNARIDFRKHNSLGGGAEYPSQQVPPEDAEPPQPTQHLQCNANLAQPESPTNRLVVAKM